MTGRLQNLIVIVTGAGCVGPGWGNGRATVSRFIEEGAKILAVDRDADALQETLRHVQSLNGEVIPHLCDVTQEEEVANMAEACKTHFGRIDVLVNNVGGSAKGGPENMDLVTWRKQLDLNLTSIYLTCRHVLPTMAEQGKGAIVNTSSTSGIRWSGAAHSAYAASKAGVIQFSRVVAIEYASRGIRVNTVIPGLLHTPLVEARLAGQSAGGDVEALLKERLARIPLAFMGNGLDTANAALFLASDEARFITGTEIVVDGGMSVRCD